MRVKQLKVLHLIRSILLGISHSNAHLMYQSSLFTCVKFIFNLYSFRLYHICFIHKSDFVKNHSPLTGDWEPALIKNYQVAGKRKQEQNQIPLLCTLQSPYIKSVHLVLK